MRNIKLILLGILFVVLLTYPTQALETNSIMQRMENGFPNQVVVYEQVYNYETPYLSVSATIPQVTMFANKEWEKDFNKQLVDNFNRFLAEVDEVAKKNSDYAGKRNEFTYELLVNYDVKLNRGGLLSLTIRSYYYTGGAHGMTVVDYVNVDLITGHHIHFSDLFESEQDLQYVSQVINERVTEEPETYLIDEFTSDLLDADQDFYLHEDGVMVCFGLYELAPYVAGIQEFAIPTP